MKNFWVMGFLLFNPSVQAEDVVHCLGTSYEFCRSIGDTTIFLTNPNDLTTTKPGYLYQVAGCTSLLPGVENRYRKCVDTNADAIVDDVVEMTQAEKDAIDQPEKDAKAKSDAFDAEIATNDLCTAELVDITSRIDTEKTAIDTAINAAGNVAQLKTAMLNANGRYAAAFKKIARCLKARAGR